MALKYAVAIIKGDNEKILGLFDTKEEADEFGMSNKLPREEGLQYCYSTLFSRGGIPKGNQIRVYTYYNA